jgi:hypothetical protein
MSRWLRRLLSSAEHGKVAAKRLVGPRGSRRRRRLTVLAPLVALLVVPSLVLAINLPPTGTGGVSNGAQFEVDGNKLSQTAGLLDWADGPLANDGAGVIEATRILTGDDSGKCNQTNTQTLGTPTTNGAGVLVCDGSVATNKPLNNPDQNSAALLGGGGFVQGQHEEESPAKASPPDTTTALWSIADASSPKKSDLAEVMAYAKSGDSVYDPDTANDDLFFVFDATRLDINGDFHVDFELNQVARNDCDDTNDNTFCQPRSADDVLISFDTTVSGALVTSVYKYVTTGSPTCATTSAGIGVPPGCYVLQTSPPTPPEGTADDHPASFALFNAAEINSPPWQSAGCDPVTGDNKPGCKLRTKMPAGGDMEGYLDLTAFIPNFNPCPGFGQLNPKSRSSSGINSSLQDDAGAVPFNVSICKSLLIRKEGKDASTQATNDLLGGATFTITPNPTTGTGSLDVTDNGTGDELSSSAGLICVKASVDGPFTIVEKTAPTNYIKDNTQFTGKTASNTDCATRSTAAGSEDAKFVNTPLSTIEVKFDSLVDGALGDATTASIVCAKGATTVPANTENGSADPARDDTDEVFGHGSNPPQGASAGLEPGVYTCTVDIDP